ncbi:hypothetical protein D9757_005332 [Collybiopsis confluens]|uniref:Uncharacterized protein n=1 Tax=Collybiopsis confluens TaxID=2823264 RepID=A0A8H5M998_9AGAR|nr:hypothetical protein D9757_005332 [Collybiopsis confluens]
MNQDPQQPHPYVLKQKIKLEGATIRHLAPFPEGWLDGAYWRAWHRTSALFDPPLAKRLETKLFTTETWKAMTAQFQNALVVAGDQKIYILWPFDAESCPVMVQLPPVLSTKSQKVPSDKINATWALNPDNPYEPLVLFTVDRLVYIFNVCTRKLEGCLRGHGGEITSIAVHPFCPHIFITTSRDYTSRIYDLTRTPQKELNNPPWPPMTVQSRAGPAFALDAPGGEGFGIGNIS